MYKKLRKRIAKELKKIVRPNRKKASYKELRRMYIQLHELLTIISAPIYKEAEFVIQELDILYKKNKRKINE